MPDFRVENLDTPHWMQVFVSPAISDKDNLPAEIAEIAISLASETDKTRDGILP